MSAHARSSSAAQVVEPRNQLRAVIDIIEEASEFAYIVTPFVKTDEWTELHDAVRRAVIRGVEVVLVTRPWRNASWDREAMRTSIETMRRLGVRIHDAPLLHAKLYVNESAAVVGSFNLWRKKRHAETVDLSLRLDDPTVHAYCVAFARDPKLHGGSSRANRSECPLCDAPDPAPRPKRRSSACARWANGISKPLLARAREVRDAGLLTFGSSARSRCRKYYFAATGDGSSSQLYRLVARTDHLELRVPVADASGAQRRLAAADVRCKTKLDAVVLPVPARGGGNVMESVTRVLRERFRN